MKTPDLRHLDVDPDAPASDEELRAAAELRDALADPSRESDEAALARALVLAHSPKPISDEQNRALIERALSRSASVVTTLAPARARRTRVIWFSAATTALAIAAAAMVFQAPSEAPVARALPHEALHARSTQPLFHEPFAAHGGASARIDRIASARALDLRENRFARWDVR
jgi:hypothetical protein